jgi:hypothetical protein
LNLPYGQRIFGLLVTAVDGTVFDVARTKEMRGRFATPWGGRFPQVRVVTLVACGTRRARREYDSGFVKRIRSGRFVPSAPADSAWRCM